MLTRLAAVPTTVAVAIATAIAAAVPPPAVTIVAIAVVATVATRWHILRDTATTPPLMATVAV